VSAAAAGPLPQYAGFDDHMEPHDSYTQFAHPHAHAPAMAAHLLQTNPAFAAASATAFGHAMAQPITQTRPVGRPPNSQRG